jgi:tetratricopeptide (TPR) repeat protein
MALAELGRSDEASAEFAAALKLKPDFAQAQYQLGEVLLKQGRLGEATRWFAAAVKSRPDSAEAHQRLGMILAEEQKTGEAIQHLREAVRLKPKQVETLNELAWTLATHTDAKIRDGTTAVRLATEASQLAGGTNANVLDTLATAFAETGQYAEATRRAQRALEIARAEGRTNLAAQIEERLRLYDARQPFHEKLRTDQ